MAVVFAQEQKRSKEALYEEWGSYMPPGQFSTMVGQYTQDHRALVVKNNIPTAFPSRKLFHHRALDPGPFVMGCFEFWEGERAYREKLLEAQSAALHGPNARQSVLGMGSLGALLPRNRR